MSDITRRIFMASTASAAAVPAIKANEKIGIQSPNQPDPLLDGATLPTFRFALEKSEAKIVGGNSAREATVRQLPISKGIAGVSMHLEPGGMRELHWHATAAEWAFVVSGRVRTTTIEPSGNSETNDFESGDIWYFPRGHGHSIQCLGDKPSHFILIFDNGYFSEFGTFSVTDWLGHVSPEVLSKNLGLPPESFANFPKKEVYFSRGPIPPQDQGPEHRGQWQPNPSTHRYQLMKDNPIGVFPGGVEWRADSSRFPISTTITGLVMDIFPGGLRELHWHPTADEWQYILSGRVRVSMFGSNGRYREEILEKGDVGYIPMGYGHSIENLEPETTSRVLIGLNSGTFQSIDLSTWLGSNPDYLLAQTFGVSKDLIAGFPKNHVVLAKGKPPEEKGKQK
jgi:oxalate decarboxylase